MYHPDHCQHFYQLVRKRGKRVSAPFAAEAGSDCLQVVFKFANHSEKYPVCQPLDEFVVEFLCLHNFVAAPDGVANTDDESENVKHKHEKPNGLVRH